MMASKTIFVAASWPLRARAVALAGALRRAGFAVRARWLEEPDGDYAKPPAEMERIARMCLEDLDKCDTLVCVTGDRESRGGKHAEFGAALVLRLRLLVYGPRETPYHHMPQVGAAECVPDLVALLRGGGGGN